MATDLEEKEETEITEPPMYQILIHNDDYTPFDFVIELLSTVFNMKTETAFEVAKEAHERGQGLCGKYTKEVAETKIEEAHTHAKNNEFPLKLTMEPVQE